MTSFLRKQESRNLNYCKRVTNKVTSKDGYIEKSPLFAFASVASGDSPRRANPPECGKEGYIASLWQREVRRDFLNNVVILMAPLVAMNILWLARGMTELISYPDGQPSNRQDISSNISAGFPQ
jgi:hypothetical protein